MAMMLRLFLILTLIAGSVLMAPTRGAMAGFSQIEICSGTGATTVTLDVRGNPVGPQHPCPDCIACVAMGLLPEMGAARSSAIVLSLTYPLPHSVSAAGIITIHPTARGPPLSA